MMSRINRNRVFDPNVVGVYHCMHRVVRRARLCGRDEQTQRSYDYRKQWVENQLISLSSIFAFDMLSYAVLDNHLHLVTRNRPDILREWSDDEVLNRWWQLCPKRREADGSPAIATEAELALLLAEQGEGSYRDRLGSISWLMRFLAEPIARRANREDECTGHFWEGRFKCQRLLDEAGLLACCAYVDLNPIRAGIVQLPESYRHTSIFKRITAQIEEAALLTGLYAEGGVIIDSEGDTGDTGATTELIDGYVIETDCDTHTHELGGEMLEYEAVPMTESVISDSAGAINSPDGQSSFGGPELLVAKEMLQHEFSSKQLAAEMDCVAAQAEAVDMPDVELLLTQKDSRTAVASRADAWLAPVELDARASAYSGPKPSRTKCRASDKGFLHMTSEAYIKLVDWLGRQVRGDRGTIPAVALPILERIGLSPDDFCDLVQRFGKIFKQAAGAPAALAKEAARRNQRWIQCNNSPLRDMIAAPATG